MIYELPDTLDVNGVSHPIRTDFRDILRIMISMNDPNLEENEKTFICLYVVYEDFENIAKEDYQAAFKAAINFIDCGKNEEENRITKKKTVDFEQDERLIISAVNKAAGFEVRTVEYMHWWTFMSYFMEIGECLYSTVLNLRSKRNKGKQLEKWEQEFWNENKDICVLKEKLSEEEKALKERLKQMLD